VHISARADYAIRAMLAIGAVHPRRVTTPHLAETERLPLGYLQAILVDLRRAGLLCSHRGADGGYALARSAQAITVGDILRATTGRLTTVRGVPTDQATYRGAARHLRGVWISVDVAISEVVDHATLADLLAGEIPA
jgi:Rrf2 family protein